MLSVGIPFNQGSVWTGLIVLIERCKDLGRPVARLVLVVVCQFVGLDILILSLNMLIRS